jgi:hypothetical protein
MEHFYLTALGQIVDEFLGQDVLAAGFSIFILAEKVVEVLHRKKIRELVNFTSLNYNL